MMFRNGLLIVSVFLLALFAAGVSPVDARDCGWNCQICGLGSYEGTMEDDPAPYLVECVHAIFGICPDCGGSVNDDLIDAMAIAEMIESLSAAELSALVEAYGDRLLLNPERGLLIVQGNGCDVRALEIAIFLPPAKVRALERLRVGSLQAFLASETQETQVV